jgi:homoserine trans-succinylase
MCKFLGTIPSDQLQYAKVPFWNNLQIPLSKHSWESKIIAIWNTKGRVYNIHWLAKEDIEN